MFKSRQSEMTVTLKPLFRIFSEKGAEEMASKEPLEARCQHSVSAHPHAGNMGDTQEHKVAASASILFAPVQKTCFMCLIPYVLKKTMMINAQSPKINPPGGCQSFCFGFWCII